MDNLGHYIAYILIFFLLLGGYSYFSNPYFKNTIDPYLPELKNNVGLITELNKNPEAHIGENITLSGFLVKRALAHTIENKEGYRIWLEDNCIESQRDYEYRSRYYEVNGIFLAPSEGQDVTRYYRISCFKKLE